MFDFDEDEDRGYVQKIRNSTLPKTTQTTQLYTKKFTRAEWEKLDVVLEIGNPKTIQDLLLERYNIEFMEETVSKTNPVKSFQYIQLEKTLKTVLKADRENFINAMKLRKKFLIYAENSSVADWIKKLDFKEIDISEYAK